jgi:hypothetical protein
MARVFLEEISQKENNEENFEIAKLFDENYKDFKKVLGREVMKMMRKKLKEDFEEVEKLKIDQIGKNNKKNAKDPEKPTQNLQTPKETQKLKQILPNPLETFQNLLNFSLELFNLGWISFENFQNLLEFFIIEENFEMVSKILKATSRKLSQSSKVLKFKVEMTPKSVSEIYHYLSVVEQLENVQKAVENNSKKVKVMKNCLKVCDLDNFKVNFVQIENFEFLVEEILKDFISQAILNDSTEFAKVVENFNEESQKLLIKILTEKFKKLIEGKSSKLFEVLGIFDFFASLLVVKVVQISHFDKIFEILLKENSKLLKVFFEIFGAQFEKFYPENLEQYFEKIEMKLKISKCETLREVDKFGKSNFKAKENSEKLMKVEENFETLNAENSKEISIKLQKIIYEDFTEFVNILWKFLLKNSENSQNYLKLCENFKNYKNFHTQLEEFLTFRRRTFLRISNENFPNQARIKLENIQKFIKNLYEAEIVSEDHWNLWNEPHVMLRIKMN